MPFDLSFLFGRSNRRASQDLLDAALAWDDALSNPHYLSVPDGFEKRNISNPPHWEAPDAIKGAPWNISPEDLLKKAPDDMVYRHVIAGKKKDDLIVRKIYENGIPTGFSGLPKTGVTGPGILGKGYFDEKPTPVTTAADLILLEQDEKTGEIFAYLGQRPDYCFAGGIIDQGEAAIDAGIREFFEEVIMASYNLEEDANAILSDRKWDELSEEEKLNFCHILKVDQSFAKEPGIAEFKYQVLKAKKPEAIEEISKFFESQATESYAGLANADPRTSERAIHTTAFSMVIKEAELLTVLGRHGLSMNVKSDEIGELKRFKITPDILIPDDKDPSKNGMFASHGPILLQALAHQIKLGNIDSSLGEATQQITNIVNAVGNEKVRINQHILETGGGFFVKACHHIKR